MGGRIGVRMGGIGDQDGDIPPDDTDLRNKDQAKVLREPEREPLLEERKVAEAENQYNVEDDTDVHLDG